MHLQMGTNVLFFHWFCSFLSSLPCVARQEDLDELRKIIKANEHLISTNSSRKFLIQKVVPEIMAKDLENLEFSWLNVTKTK